ncbi:cytidine deaminase [Propylenella binzhouense]|uniref:Cytidine deaminase n=1 Tax=Propylenella binzhouense TaxID=2555902 RepID=A0A964T543_9HYPH|nr:cytidine deaminase [Propylenella binzhouense]MYZ48691.1 cytidine deaminase [Propylenella binzhouense]
MADESHALFQAARNAMAFSHSPYSKFPVGAAVRTPSGAIYAGCNVENASYPEGWCAETTAIGHMIMGGDWQIAEIAVVAEKMERATPCGGCRQRLAEFSTPETKVHLCDAEGVVETVLLADLLPHAFGLGPR